MLLMLDIERAFDSNVECLTGLNEGLFLVVYIYNSYQNTQKKICSK